MITSNEIRSRFLEYFKDSGHEIVASSPLIPGNDPTLLFTNAGMVQFKDVFTGVDKRSYLRAVTAQRCVRAGGKHNDLENVGYTARHHTFFEMLGNFSFGDYFKRDAIRHAWKLLTEGYGLPSEKLWITVFEDDDEAEAIWRDEIGVAAERITRCGEKDNFWSMGDTGPCGPCSEIFYDHGPEVEGGPPGSPEEDGDRYIEIWNLVFMQFDRDADGTMRPLPRPSVDTGMGLERLAAVLQDVHSNYDIDLFRHLIQAAADVTRAPDLNDKSLRVVADHIRSCAFLVTDGVVPSNEGRGYVLRRIIRRAIRHGHRLGVREPFFYRLVRPLDQEMGEAYPELRRRLGIVERVLRQEEERFAETLDQGMRILEQAFANLPGKTVPGETVFRLYDTYGFPADLTADVARERGLDVDLQGFEAAMSKQREASRDASKFSSLQANDVDMQATTSFTGYDRLDDMATVIALYDGDGEPVLSLGPEDHGLIATDATPFYSESGGQIGDRGTFSAEKVQVEITDTQRRGNAVLHSGVVTEGSLTVGVTLTAAVNAEARLATARNHSATHLLHSALRKVLGDHVTQKGSLVAPERLRFDFSHFEPVTAEELSEIERRVNEWILSNVPVSTEVMALDSAVEKGALALFGEKYDDNVRVLSMGNNFSIELCGGTHVRRTGDIGVFHIVSETGIAVGVRRIEAVTGRVALDWFLSIENTLDRIAESTKGSRENISDRILDLVESNKKLQKELDTMKVAAAKNQSLDLVDRAVDVSGINVLGAVVSGSAGDVMKTLDGLKDRLGDCVVMLGYITGGKVNLACSVTKSISDKINASAAINYIGHQVGARGGGKPVLARAGGGDNTAALPVALESLAAWVGERLSE